MTKATAAIGDVGKNDVAQVADQVSQGKVEDAKSKIAEAIKNKVKNEIGGQMPSLPGSSNEEK